MRIFHKNRFIVKISWNFNKNFEFWFCVKIQLVFTKNRFLRQIRIFSTILLHPTFLDTLGDKSKSNVETIILLSSILLESQHTRFFSLTHPNEFEHVSYYLLNCQMSWNLSFFEKFSRIYKKFSEKRYFECLLKKLLSVLI